MEKNKKKKFRDIRNAVVMMCVMIAMMSTASYAWFTMASSPTVTGMKMTAATSGGGLQVANVPTGEGNTKKNYFDSITIVATEDPQVLKPVTPDLAETPTTLFKAPVYTGTEVTGFTAIDDATLTGYVAKYTYWLKETTTNVVPSADKTVGVGIICGDSTSTNEYGLTGADGTAPKLPGSFVRKSISETSPEGIENPSYAVRVGFVVTSDYSTSKLIMWEPNVDGAKEVTQGDLTMATVASAADVKTAVVDATALRSNRTGTIVKGGTGNTSEELFKVPVGGEVKVDMYVWLEGSDDLCANEIQAGALEAQVQFTVVTQAEAENANP